MTGRQVLWLAVALPLAACGQSGAGGTGTATPTAAAVTAPPAPPPPANATAGPSTGLVAGGDTLHFTGTEPFWGGEVSGTSLTYSTPANQQGATIEVTRATAADRLAFSGTLSGQPLALAIIETQCSDGMSDRIYPFTATLKLGGELRRGCAWSQAHPFGGPQRPLTSAGRAGNRD